MSDQNDFVAQLKARADQLLKEQKSGKKQHIGSQGDPPPPATPPHKFILYVFDSKCKNCGAIETFSNHHVLACYRPNQFANAYHARPYIGPFLPGVPKVLVRQFAEQEHDYCRLCFPADRVTDDLAASTGTDEERRD